MNTAVDAGELLHPVQPPAPDGPPRRNGPEDSGWFTVVGRCRTPVESRTGDDTAHRAVTAVQRCPSRSRSARSAGTPWANTRQNASDPRRWRGSEVSSVSPGCWSSRTPGEPFTSRTPTGSAGGRARSRLSERLRTPAEPRRTAVRARRPRSRSPSPIHESPRSAHGPAPSATLGEPSRP